MVAARPENPPPSSDETTPDHPPPKPDESSMMMPPPAKPAADEPKMKMSGDQPTSDVKVADTTTEHQNERQRQAN